MSKDQRLLECFKRLRSDEFAPLRAWFASERANTLERLATAPENMVKVLQGEAMVFKNILNLIESASAALDKQAGR